MIEERNNVDCIILTNTADLMRYGYTARAINTLRLSEKYTSNTSFNICVVESNTDALTKGFYYDTLTTSTAQPFNYNKALNDGIEHHRKTKGKLSDWVLVSNNDVVYTESWFSRILEVYRDNKNIKSFCPFNPLSEAHQTMQIVSNNIVEGYRVPYELVGWSILFRSELVNQLNLFDEQFPFYYQDNDYSETLRFNNVRHALIPNSIVYHEADRSHDLIESSRKKQLTVGALDIFNKKWRSM